MGRADERVRFLGGVWDQELLDQLYANALVYWHGHSVRRNEPLASAGHRPAAPTNAFDVDFNREVLAEAGTDFATPRRHAAAGFRPPRRAPEAAPARGRAGPRPGVAVRLGQRGR